MKEIKQKPAGGKPKTADAARVPKAVVKAAWLQAREAARAGEKQVVGGKDGAYCTLSPDCSRFMHRPTAIRGTTVRVF